MPCLIVEFDFLSTFSDEQIDQVGQRRENRSSSHEQEATINGEVKPSCCADCLAKLEDEARNLETSYKTNEPALSSLPSWLKDESRRLGNNDQVIILSTTLV